MIGQGSITSTKFSTKQVAAPTNTRGRGEGDRGRKGGEGASWRDRGREGGEEGREGGREGGPRALSSCEEACAPASMQCQCS